MSRFVVFYLVEIFTEPRSYYRVKLPRLFYLIGILPELRPIIIIIIIIVIITIIIIIIIIIILQ